MFKKLMAFMITAAVLLSFAGCGKTESGDNTKKEGSTTLGTSTATATVDGSAKAPKMDVTLKIWHNYMPDVAKTLTSSYDQFQQETGVKVAFEKLEDFDKKVETASQSGNLPDLIIKSGDATGKYSIIGAAVPIDDLVDKNVLDGLLSNAVDAFRYKDHLYGIPVSLETVTLIYNKKLISQPPTNTNELITKAKELTKGGTYGFLIPPKDQYFNSAFFFGAGGGYLDKEGKASLDTPENVEACKILVELAKLYPKDLEHQMVSQLFRDGKAAMMVNGPWEIPNIKKANIDYGLARIPVVSKTNQSNPIMGAQGMFMTSNCKEKDAAKLVLSYFAGEKLSKALALAGGYIPANKNVRQDNDIIKNTDIAGFMDQTEVGVPASNLPEMSAMYTPLDSMLSEIVVQQQPIEAALKKYQAKAEEAINNMK